MIRQVIIAAIRLMYSHLFTRRRPGCQSSSTPRKKKAARSSPTVHWNPTPSSRSSKHSTKKPDLTVEYWRASATKVMDRALAELRAGKPAFDVMVNNSGAI